MNKSPTVKTHPLMEILARKLFGLESIPKEHRRRQINSAIKEAVKAHSGVLKEEPQKYNFMCDVLCSLKSN